MTDLTAIVRGLKDAVAFSRRSTSQAGSLARQTNTVLYGTFGIAVGALLGTGAVVAGGTIFLPFIPIAILIGGTSGVLFNRTKVEIDDEDDEQRLDRLFKRRDDEVAQFNAQIKLGGPGKEQAEALIIELLKADAETLQRRYLVKPKAQIGAAAKPALIAYTAHDTTA